MKVELYEQWLEGLFSSLLCSLVFFFKVQNIISGYWYEACWPLVFFYVSKEDIAEMCTVVTTTSYTNAFSLSYMSFYIPWKLGWSYKVFNLTCCIGYINSKPTIKFVSIPLFFQESIFFKEPFLINKLMAETLPLHILLQQKFQMSSEEKELVRREINKRTIKQVNTLRIEFYPCINKPYSNLRTTYKESIFYLW